MATRRLRIVMAGEFWLGASGHGLAAGLKRLGHDVRCVELADVFPLQPTIFRRIDMRLRNTRYADRYRTAIRNAVIEHRPEILLTLKGSYFDAELLADMARLGVGTVNFYPDVLFDHGDISAAIVTAFGLIVTTKTYHMPWLSQRLPAERYAYVPHGYSKACHIPRMVPHDDSGFQWDICYVGNASDYKRRWIAPLIAATPDLRWNIIGHGWSDQKAPNCQVTGPLHGTGYADAVAQSRINLAIHSGPVGPDDWEDSVSTRSFEIPASGGFMLHIDNPEIREFYTPGLEIDVFSSHEEAVAKLRHYLAHPEKRMAIAAAGCSRATPAYSYDERAVEMMAIVEQRFGLSASF